MSRAVLKLVRQGAPRPAAPPDDAGWLAWLETHTDPGWRPGEWDQGIWLFTGDLESPRTRAWPCRTPGCPATTRRHKGRCDACRRALSVSQSLEEDFDVSPERAAVRALVPPRCVVGGCGSDFHYKGLCFRHARRWERQQGASTLEDFIAGAVGFARLAACLVGGCGREQWARRGLCRFHDQRLRQDARQGNLDDVLAWAARQSPKLGAHQFSLAPLSDLVRAELLYAIQCRDVHPAPLDPSQIRILVARLIGVDSIRSAERHQVTEAGGQQYNSDIRWFFTSLRRDVERAWLSCSGIDPMAGDVWQVSEVGLGANASRPWTPASEATIDFTVVGLVWLREVMKAWVRDTRPYLQELRQALAAMRLASNCLLGVGRAEPATLDAGDFTRVLDALSRHRRADGTMYSAGHRKLMVCRFCEVIEHGRESGLMASVGEFFRPTRRRYRIEDDPNEDEVGKALPESVISCLDDHLNLLGSGGRAGWMSGDDAVAMHQTIYRILRDTGRRPGEVVSLKLGCVEVIDGTHNLIYDNNKAARLRRRLPITTETAALILAFEERRLDLAVPPSAAKWLFPSPQQRRHQSLGYLGTGAFGRVFRDWVRRIPVIDSELLGSDGRPLPFDRALIFPYALRHSYAQRHADAGVAVDVLKELMDHTSIQTTMGYYSVSLKRKVTAVAKVGSLAVDASGHPAPFADTTAYERASVSVPFGNCTEPSNVRAGGGHCPIRFQCAGCGFYRPDPSYLPALEEHIASLRADLETARAIGAAAFVVLNLSAEVDAFSKVAAKMRRRLERLGAEERAEVEQASRLLRRARAARRIPVVAAGAGEAG